MNLILLPGNSRENRTWIDLVEHQLGPSFSHTAVHYYDHWWTDESDAELDFDSELLKLAGTVQEFDKYVIFAKSAGVLLAMRGIFEGILEPSVCFFVGTAVNWGLSKGLDINTWFANYDVPTLFIQKEQDPAIPYTELVSFLDSNNVTGYHAVSIAGNDHSYSDVDLLCQHIQEFYDL